MPDEAAVAKSSFGFLGHKLGPLPIGVYLVVLVGLVWYFRQQQMKSSGTPTAQTDPAGNTGSIDPQTGYVYGSPSDQAALAASNPGSSSDGTSAGTTGTSGAQVYADNNTWGIAAVNYLAGLGIDAVTANQAIQQYLSSQNLTGSQQADVNLAIRALGPPPSLPGPTSSNPPPVTTPGGGTGGTKPPTGNTTVPKVTGLSASAAVAALTKVGLKAGSEGAKGGTAIVNSQTPGAGSKVAKGSTVDLGLAKSGSGGTKKSVPPPTGLTVTAKHSHTASVKWNRVPGATGYRVRCTDQATKAVTTHDAIVHQPVGTLDGLTPSHSYTVDVWAQPEGTSGAHAETSFTTPRTG